MFLFSTCRARHGFLVGLLIAFTIPLAAMASGSIQAGDLAIVGATLVDVTHAGRTHHDQFDTVIIVRGGRIASVGNRRSTPVPSAMPVIDASGKFVIPGLIDGFGSLRSQGFADAYLYEGVTSVFVNKAPVGQDGEQGVATTEGGPRILRGITIGGYSREGVVPDTHPWTEYKLNARRLSAADLKQVVTMAAAGGARGVMTGLDVWPDQLRVIADAARANHLAVVGEMAFTSYPEAIGAGTEAFVRNDHYLASLASPQKWQAYSDDPQGKAAGMAYRAACQTDPESPVLSGLAQQLARSRTALMPLLSIEATADDVGATNPWQSRSAVFVTADELDDPVDQATGTRPYLENHADRRSELQSCARRRQDLDGALHRQGVAYLAGSGAPAYGILPGGGLHQEIRLLQHIGLSPREALAAATSNFVDAFGWSDVGRIEPGRAGDLVVLNGDPRVDASVLDDIHLVVHDGRVVDRAALLARAKGKPMARDGSGMDIQ